MNIVDLIYRYDQWGMRQNHAGRKITIDSTTLTYYQYQWGIRQNHADHNTIIRSWG